MAAGLGAVHYRTGGASHPDTACAKPAGMNRKSDQDPPDDPVAEAILALLAEQAYQLTPPRCRNAAPLQKSFACEFYLLIDGCNADLLTTRQQRTVDRRVDLEILLSRMRTAVRKYRGTAVDV